MAYRKVFVFERRGKLVWENSRHLAMLPLVSPPNDVWETSAEIPYWWRVTTQIWVVLLIGRAAWEFYFNQSEALPRSGWWRVISMQFLRLFLRRHLAGAVVASPNVGCFLRLGENRNLTSKILHTFFFNLKKWDHYQTMPFLSPLMSLHCTLTFLTTKVLKLAAIHRKDQMPTKWTIWRTPPIHPEPPTTQWSHSCLLTF